MSTAEYNVRATGALIDELVHAGVGHICMAPGSRSAPLVLAADRHPDIELHMITDERSAAFFALGLAKQSGVPVAVGCTSGTAAANFGPALIEAALSHIPLIVLTADRPPEQLDVAAAQTIRQTGLFANHAKWSTCAPVPDATVSIDLVFRNLAARLATHARELRGPVHANLPLREPLWDEHVDDLLAATRCGQSQATRVSSARSTPDPAAIAALAEDMAKTPRGLIIAGGRDVGELDTRAAINLAEHLGWPVLVDGLSELRPLVSSHELLIDTQDVLARCPSNLKQFRPDTLLRIGAPPTSKALAQLLVGWAVEPDTLLTARTDWPDPSLSVSNILRGDPNLSLRLLSETVAAPREQQWRESWIGASQRARRVLDDAAGSQHFEGAIARATAAALAPGDQLMVGNSMPVRDIDLFASDIPEGVRIHANRGANGIDGVTSTALGIATVGSGHTVLLVGDLSFLHDIGALQIAANSEVDLTIVVPTPISQKI